MTGPAPDGGAPEVVGLVLSGILLPVGGSLGEGRVGVGLVEQVSLESEDGTTEGGYVKTVLLSSRGEGRLGVRLASTGETSKADLLPS